MLNNIFMQQTTNFFITQRLFLIITQYYSLSATQNFIFNKFCTIQQQSAIKHCNHKSSTTQMVHLIITQIFYV